MNNAHTMNPNEQQKRAAQDEVHELVPKVHPETGEGIAYSLAFRVEGAGNLTLYLMYPDLSLISEEMRNRLEDIARKIGVGFDLDDKVIKLL